MRRTLRMETSGAGASTNHHVVLLEDGEFVLSRRIDDSSRATLAEMPRERRLPEPPAFIAGTLAYMAPEQTGWMNRSIDTRSDLYALGVVLYELLTGSLPFTASDPMAWVHCHIARRPEPPLGRRHDL